MLILIRILIFILIIYLLYRAFKYVVNPKRKLELAMEQKKFYFLDDQENIRKNFLVTYKGILFQGEKYLGTTDQAFDVISIFVWVENSSSLKGMSYEDLKYVETEILERYPNASIDWKSPLKEFIN
ncbi:sigma-w pathway protein ysdB, partial [Bacillus salacetis]|uniref:sigma-w pathway protein ysdB n=1 Tax=Bacillus salacetis TaxID=2315464 RepID=UPI0014441076